MHLESERAVERDRARVVGRDEEHCRGRSRARAALGARRSRGHGRGRCPARADRRRSRRSRPSPDRARSLRASFSQLKPASPRCRTRAGTGSGSNQGSARRALQCRLVPAALLGMARERAVVHGEPVGVVATGIERAHRDTGRPTSALPRSGAARASRTASARVRRPAAANVRRRRRSRRTPST